MAITLRVLSVEQRVQMVETRMPFRYGSAKLVRCPHLFVAVTIRGQNGRQAQGIASDNLPPKWFDKAPEKSYLQELQDQLSVISWSVQAALNAGEGTPFELWHCIYCNVQEQAKKAGFPPLLGGFGPSLLERAINDAVGNLLQQPFHHLLRDNTLGIDLSALDSSYKNTELHSILPATPLSQIDVRHTVGLSDPIRAADIPADERLHDGLPQSLDEVIDFYGVRGFKIKVQNQLPSDLARLEAIAALLDEKMPQSKYFSTLDGNEQYNDFEELIPLLSALRERPSLRRLREPIVFVEQPLARHVALDAERCRGLNAITQHFPVIIDESDGTFDAFACALQLGYSGTSHKNCKNTFKTVLNLARAKQAEDTLQRPIILSAEDLTNIGPIALNQDLTALSSLGISHAERNGHHYFQGLWHVCRDAQDRALRAHPDLYVRDGEQVRVHIQNGAMSCRSLHTTPGLGAAAWPNWEIGVPVEQFDLKAAAE